MYCYKCGKELEENSAVCDNCGAEIKDRKTVEEPKKEKKKLNIYPTAAVSLVFSILACFVGFVLITCCLAAKFGTALLDIFVLIPAMVGLGIGVYNLFKFKEDQTTKVCSYISIGLSSFILLYDFIAYMVLILS